MSCLALDTEVLYLFGLCACLRSILHFHYYFLNRQNGIVLASNKLILHIYASSKALFASLKFVLLLSTSTVRIIYIILVLTVYDYVLQLWLQGGRSVCQRRRWQGGE